MIYSFLYSIASIFVLASSQSSPIFDTAKSLYVGGDQAQLTNDDIKNFTVNFPNNFTISTLGIRKPFFAISSIQQIQFQSKQAIYFWSRIVKFSSTSMIFQLENFQFTPGFGPVETYGFKYYSVVKFRYLLVRDTFPTIYFCNTIESKSVPLTISSTTPYKQNFTMSTISAPAAAPLLLGNDTIFLHSFTDSTFILTKASKDSSFGISFTFSVQTTTKFSLKVTSKYPMELKKLKIMVMIYNQLQFQSYEIIIQYKIFTFSGLLADAGSRLEDNFAAAFLPGTNSFFYGICGFNFSQYKKIGFGFSIDPVSSGNNYKIVLNNLVPASAIPSVQLLILLVSELKCPNGQILINQGLNKCYNSTCPLDTYLSTQQVGVTGIRICQACIQTCQTCSKSSSNCTSCYAATQFRSLVNSSCLPISHYFDNSVAIAQQCSITCKQCSLTSTHCTSCNTSAYLSAMNTCINCTIYHLQCLTCNSSTCLACNNGYIVTVSGDCKACSDYDEQCATCDSSKCTGCNLGLFWSGTTCQSCLTHHTQCLQCTTTSCTSCNSPYIVSPTKFCLECSDYNQQCSTCNDTTCQTCNVGFFLSASDCFSCLGYYPQCAECNSTQCIRCDTNYILNFAGNCITCSDYHTQCVTCSDVSCLTCNQRYYQIGTGCDSCSIYHAQCLSCSGSRCSSCSKNFAVKGSSCISCASYHQECLTCDSNVCLQCSAGYFIKNNSCFLCSLTFNQQCLSCNTTQCLTCQPNYFLNLKSYECETIQCGDGKWIVQFEACDDGNFDNNDGCDHQCHIEPDFICLQVDKLPSGASSCKFNKNLTLNFTYIKKDISSNTVHLFFDLHPASLKGWSEQNIKKMLSPVEIVDEDTNTAKTIPIESLEFSFHRNQESGQVQLTINYGQNSLENSFLRFNLDPTKTNISSIDSLPSQNDLHVKLDSESSGVYLFGYSQDVYDFQGIIQTLGITVGLFSLMLLFLGFCVPAGKLIILEALAVVQITYFSLLQFDKIPPTFIGFRNLIYSNGYNDPNMISPSSNSNNLLQVFKLIGLNIGTLQNYNLSFLILLALPAVLGMVGILLAKLSNKNNSKQAIKEEEVNEQRATMQKNKTKSQLIETISKRLLLESMFYGLLITGYLAWISIFNSISEKEVLNLAFNGIISTLWITYIILLFITKTQVIDLKQFFPKRKFQLGIASVETQISTGPAQFKLVHGQIKVKNLNKTGCMERIYFIFICERILMCAVILFISKFLNFVSGVILLTFLSLLVGINIIRKKSNNSLMQQQRKPLFSYLQKNYVLRQSINFLTIIIIQLLYLTLDVLCASRGAQQTFSFNVVTVKIAPIAILAILCANLIFNTFLWIKQLRSQKLIYKARVILSILFTDIDSLQTLNKNKLNESSVQVKDSDQKKSGVMNDSKNQEDQMTNLLNQYLQSSPIFQSRNSPFLGAEQKSRRKDSFMSVLRLQCVQNQQNEKMNEMPNFKDKKFVDIWDQI